MPIFTVIQLSFLRLTRTVYQTFIQDKKKILSLWNPYLNMPCKWIHIKYSAPSPVFFGNNTYTGKFELTLASYNWTTNLLSLTFCNVQCCSESDLLCLFLIISGDASVACDTMQLVQNVIFFVVQHLSNNILTSHECWNKLATPASHAFLFKKNPTYTLILKLLN